MVTFFSAVNFPSFKDVVGIWNSNYKIASQQILPVGRFVFRWRTLRAWDIRGRRRPFAMLALAGAGTWATSQGNTGPFLGFRIENSTKKACMVLDLESRVLIHDRGAEMKIWTVFVLDCQALQRIYGSLCTHIGPPVEKASRKYQKARTWVGSRWQ